MTNLWVPHRYKDGRAIFGEKMSREIVESCGRGVGHTMTLLRGAAQVADLTDGPVRLVFRERPEALCCARLFAEFCLCMGYENVGMRQDQVTVNGVVFDFVSLGRAEDPSQPRREVAIEYRDLSTLRNAAGERIGGK